MGHLAAGFDRLIPVFVQVVEQANAPPASQEVAKRVGPQETTPGLPLAPLPVLRDRKPMLQTELLLESVFGHAIAHEDALGSSPITPGRQAHIGSWNLDFVLGGQLPNALVQEQEFDQGLDLCRISLDQAVHEMMGSKEQRTCRSQDTILSRIPWIQGRKSLTRKILDLKGWSQIGLGLTGHRNRFGVEAGLHPTPGACERKPHKKEDEPPCPRQHQ